MRLRYNFYMEPETVTQEQEKFGSIKKETSAAKYLAMALFITLPFIGGWIGYQYGQNESKGDSLARLAVEERVDVSDNPEVNYEEKTYYSNKLNLSFYIPDGWEIVPGADVKAPAAISDIKLSLREPGSGCVIAFADLDLDNHDYVQTSFGARVSSNVSQYGGNWYTNQAFYESEISFSGDDRQYLAHEVLSDYLGGHSSLLWQEDNDPVSANCVKAYEGLVASSNYHYMEYSHTGYIDGLISVSRSYAGRDSGLEDTLRLVFSVEDSFTLNNGNIYEIIEMPWSVNGSRIFVDGLAFNFYSSDEDGGIVFNKYDLEKGYVEEIFEHPEGGDSYVVDYIFTSNGEVYYLAGSDGNYACMDGYKSVCSLTLYKFSPSESGKPVPLVSSVKATKIFGVAEDGTIHMARGYGDAGCVSATFSSYKDGEYQEGEGLGGCVGLNGPDEGYVEYHKRLDLIKDSITSDYTKMLFYQNSKLTATTSESHNNISSSFVILD